MTAANRRLPPLNAVRAFESAARNASFTRAAQELFVTQGAVSRHVAALERWLGAKLFKRTQRGIALTTKGTAYFRVVRGALDQIDHATRQLQQSPDENLLRLKLPPTFAIRWLIPRLARFHALHRGIDVQITTSHDTADFDREDVDTCIHSDLEPPTGPGFRRLFGEVLLPVVSPGLLKRGPSLKRPRDLARHVLLCSLHRPNDWPAWLEAARVDDIDGNSGLKFENAALAIQAAIDELGVMIAQRAFVDDDLRSGRLVAPFSLTARTSGAYYLAYHPHRPKSARLVAFEDWLLEEARVVSDR
jgi:LysR family transcriptional regulator, glycine cleavage system transcriptional activator